MATEQERNRGLGAYSTPGVDQKPDLTPAQIITTTPFVTFQLKNVAPPSNLYVTENDFIALNVKNSVAGLAPILRTRILRRDGVIQYSEDQISCTSDRSANQMFIRLTEGYLLGVQLSNAGTTVTARGQAFAICYIAHGALTPTKSFDTLFAGYFNTNNIIAWPGNAPYAAVEGPGFGRVVVGTVPAAGADISETVPSGARWSLRSIAFSLTTGAAVANREVMLLINDGVNTFLRAPSGFTQAASLGHNYCWFQSATRYDGTVQLQTVAPVGPLILEPGYKITTSTINLQAADQFAAPQYEVEEWIEN